LILGEPVGPIDLSTLSLDTAVELDRMVRLKDADLSIIRQFAARLGTPASSAGGATLFCLQENPVTVDILNSALYSVDGSSLVNIQELEAKVRDLFETMNNVASGQIKDSGVLNALKKFCLALHQILLQELSGNIDQDEWMLNQDARVA
jgi:hypothetical protein